MSTADLGKSCVAWVVRDVILEDEEGFQEVSVPVNWSAVSRLIEGSSRERPDELSRALV